MVFLKFMVWRCDLLGPPSTVELLFSLLENYNRIHKTKNHIYLVRNYLQLFSAILNNLILLHEISFLFESVSDTLKFFRLRQLAQYFLRNKQKRVLSVIQGKSLTLISGITNLKLQIKIRIFRKFIFIFM